MGPKCSERGFLVERVPGLFLPFGNVSDPPTTAARAVYGWRAEVEAPCAGTEGSDEASEPHHYPLRSLKPRCVMSVFGRCYMLA